MRKQFVAAVASLAILPASAAPGLSLNVSPNSATDVDNLSLTTTLTNTGSETLTLLNDPRTVLSSARTETFTLTNGSGSPDFIGIRVKYSPEYVVRVNDPASFTVLAPGQSREVVHNLAGVYNFTQTGHGEYKIKASDTFDYVDASGNLATLKATTQSSAFELTGNIIPKRSYSSMLRSRQGGPGFRKCSDSQKKEVMQTIPSAETSITEALSWFNTHSAATPRYTAWFGEYDLSRFDMEKEFFRKIQGKSSQTTYDCDCDMQNVFAYVYADQPGVVHLCPAFWTAPTAGADSKAGTLIHEQTHFTANGGARDYAYGKRNCRNLAASKPHLAAKNADNYEYFAENYPWEA
ncbi:unnamed protein product [Rhizoctonia solani]|uniref:Lysine-specific metallo-endopeptidase domain-containing protein n=1 Tax=Rhizoctonia solani TaxID=456999 RepID=A0A8H3G5N6_9AGAM|nr:unnamed protein product [Rhizoctonia solani]